MFALQLMMTMMTMLVLVWHGEQRRTRAEQGHS